MTGKQTECQMMQAEVISTYGNIGNVGTFSPRCTTSGNFAPQQCHDSTGYCWCVNQFGIELHATRRGPTEEKVECSSLQGWCLFLYLIFQQLSKVFSRHARELLDVL